MNTKIERLEVYWNSLPIGREYATNYKELMTMWRKDERAVRRLLHELSGYDNGDNYILVRSARNKGGFFRTDDTEIIKQYRVECLNKGRSVFAPVKKINRVLNCSDASQMHIYNNLQAMRQSKGLTQNDVCNFMRNYDTAIDTAMLSKMENGVCLPTPDQVQKFAELFECRTDEVLNFDVFEG